MQVAKGRVRNEQEKTPTGRGVTGASQDVTFQCKDPVRKSTATWKFGKHPYAFPKGKTQNGPKVPFERIPLTPPPPSPPTPRPKPDSNH
ncbi:hypothetical protein E5288_WYG004616 [Bos mutus]|uniref:Uncharacterized protein n=1 Tax=Bos mutus TaxID=72004 RepID=A0A6B0RMT2_9CETA|nr:hypothetical protein [Bos mutus]